MRRRFTLLLVGLGIGATIVLARADAPSPLALGHIGASLARDTGSGRLLVDYLATGSPAALAGIKKGDWITAIDGAPTQDMSAADVKHAATGAVGSVVTWTVRYPGPVQRQVSLVRKPILDVYLSAATAGDPAAEFYVGYFYDRSPAPARDLVQAIAWYRKSAEQGYSLAQFNLGFLYVNGLVLPDVRGDAAQRNPDQISSGERTLHQDYPNAFIWFSLAAAQDNPNAEYYLGMFYQHGHAVPRDDQKAFYWYDRAARHDIAYAQWNLAYLYENGLGVKRDLGEAMKWYVRAQTALPQNTSLRAHIALLSLRAFVENPDSASLDLSLFVTAFRPQLMPLFYLLLGAYLAGGLTLFYFTFRRREGPPGISIALGWLAFDLEGQAVALAAVYLAGALLTADNLFVATCLFSALPIILSTLGPNRKRMWQPSALSGKTLLLYGAGSLAAIFLLLQGYGQIYTFATHSAMPMQPTAVMITKAKQGSAWLTYACVAVALPMTEEILFRGYLFDALKPRCPDALVVIITAFVFALVHFQGLYFAPIFGFGLILGWVKLRTGSLRLPVLLHTLNNGLFLALAS